jgi:hypothetical protein
MVGSLTDACSAAPRLGCKTFSILFLFFVAIAPALADVNSWTNATSSYWEFQTNWSLGVLPNQSQSVYITNPGFKAVAIGPNTAQNFPQSMQIQDLQIASPTNSFNELLMNFSGFQVPLQTTSLSVYPTSAVVVLSSRLEVITTTNYNTGNAFVGGTINQGDFSRVKVEGFMSIGRYGGNGAYYLTNGSLSVITTLEIGAGQSSQQGKFIQYGGTNNVGSLNVITEGEYDLYDGEATANGINVGGGDYAGSSFFYQYGGTATGDMVVNGNYILNAGTRIGSFLVAAGGQRVDAFVVQTGGTNSASSMDLGHPNQFGGRAFYTLSNGVVHVDSSTTFGGGSFSQYNGTHTIVSNLVMNGRDVGEGTVDADYLLAGGTLSVGGLTEEAAQFTQTGGSNSIAGSLVLGLTPPTQSTGYGLLGGTLAVKDIEIDAGSFFQHTSGSIAQSGVLLLDQGQWRAANGDYVLGPLQLGAPNSNAFGFQTNSAIVFPDGSSILRLANSSTQPWAADAILYMTNWHGSASGGGATQLYFGSDSSGLTPQQLAQIRFSISGHLSSATILPTGEVVPATPPTVQFTRNGSTLTLTWPSGWFLQSATNVTGPYNDVSGATNPWPVSMTKPLEFFRLRQ